MRPILIFVLGIVVLLGALCLRLMEETVQNFVMSLITIDDL